MKKFFCKCCGIKLRLSKIPFLNNVYEFKEGKTTENYYCFSCMEHKLKHFEKGFRGKRK